MTGLIAKLQGLTEAARTGAARHRAKGEEQLADRLERCAVAYDIATALVEDGREQFVGYLREARGARAVEPQDSRAA